MTTPRTVGIIGGTLWGNRGAEAMLVTSIGQVRERYPGAQIIVFTYLAKKDAQLLTDPSITLIDSRPQALVLGHFPFAVLAWLFRLVGIKLPDGVLSPSVRALRRCDVLLDISGISFAAGREKYLPFNILIIWPAMLLGVPVVKLAQAVGPFKNPLNRIAARIFLGACYRLYARGEKTGTYLQDLKVNNWKPSADIAFLYKPAYSLSNENPDKVVALAETLAAVRAQGHMVIGLSPSSLVYNNSVKRDRDYVGQFLKLIRNLDASYHYVLLPNATREGSEKGRNNDLFVIDLIMQRSKRELSREMQSRVHAVDFDLNTDGSRQLIALCDLVVTSRFHGMVSSLSLQVPVMVIGWSHKYAEVLAEFELDHFAVDFNDPNLDMQAMINNLVTTRAEVQNKLATGLAKVQAKSAQQFSDLADLLQ
ncbi:MAG: hypothetical protein OHK0046_30410 [Anaerolineae bacterium]